MFTNSTGQTKPIVISTWETGKDVNTEAWKILSANGRALDAVEAGARQIEGTINCCVGLGGYPDRDGIVTLDSCIMDEHAQLWRCCRTGTNKTSGFRCQENYGNNTSCNAGRTRAQQFAIENGFAKEPQKLSPEAEKAYKEWLKKSEYKPVINIENKKDNGPLPPFFLMMAQQITIRWGW